jgi:ubiquinone/menaquinone biosynthesis C-methylase UbiE
MTFGQRFARLATDVTVRWPRLWPLFKPLMRIQFDRAAPWWDEMRSGDAFAALEQALAALPSPPRRALDLGTGTGKAAFLIAERFPEAEVVGVDIAKEMLADARSRTPPGLSGRVTFEAADGARLAYDDGAFDLVSLANMIPFFDELERVTAPSGAVVVSFSAGPETPIYVDSGRLRDELGARGFTEFAEFSGGRGTALVARKGAQG